MYHFENGFNSRPFSEIPGPKEYPVIGTLHSYMFGPFVRLKYHEALKMMRQTYGSIVKENLGGKVIIHVFDPEDIKTVSAIRNLPRGIFTEREGSVCLTSLC